MEVLLVGLGEIGAECAKVLAELPVTTVAAVDPRFSASTAVLADVTGHVAHREVPILAEAPRPSTTNAVALVCVGSTLEQMAPLFEQLLLKRWNIVTSCEEAVEGAAGEEVQAKRLHSICQQTDRVLISAGVNPGFVMDVLPALLSGCVRKLTRCEVTRRVNTRRRRSALGAKAGVGVRAGDFRQLAAEGKAAHIGLSASARGLARALGAQEMSVSRTVTPVTLGGIDCRTDDEIAHGYRERLLLETPDFLLDIHLEMRADVEDVDIICLESTPAIEVQIPGGVSGDTATVGALVNRVLQMPLSLPGPGFWSPFDVPPLTFRRSTSSSKTECSGLR